MSIVFDNIIFWLQGAGGVSRFWKEVAFGDRPNATYIEPLAPSHNVYRATVSPASITSDHRLPVSISRYVNFSKSFHKTPYVFHSSYLRVNTGRSAANVTTVHDLMYEKFLRGPRRFLHSKQKGAALKASTHIVCVSERTRLDLLEHYPFCAEIPISVIPNGVSQFAGEAVPTGIPVPWLMAPNRYFLYVGNRGHCKGFPLVARALDKLPSDFKCIVVGGAFTSQELTLLRQAGHIERVHNTGKVTDANLAFLYRNASFFFFPSIYEGFGIPPLEAMLSRCPILVSNQSSIPEVVGNCGLYFDPHDPSTLDSPLACIADYAYPAYLLERAQQRARTFTWEKARAAYDHVYAAALTQVSQ